MTESFAHSTTTPIWCAVTRERSSARAVGTASVRQRSGGRPSSLRLDEQRLDEVVQTCGYDIRRIAQHLGISVRHLQRWFGAHLTCTPRVWLAEQRLQRARRLLAASSSVKEVAYSLGFSQVSQFSRDFKRRFGHRPSAERARARVQPDATSVVSGTGQVGPAQDGRIFITRRSFPSPVPGAASPDSPG
jgi:AraC-like DNA-binding protein